MLHERVNSAAAVSSNRPLIVPVYIPHRGCPHRCIFCDQHRLTGHNKAAKPEDVARWVAWYRTAARVDRRSTVEIAFYGGSFTALPQDVQQDYLDAASNQVRQGMAHSIRISTRPDAIDGWTITRLKDAGVAVVELGVQSMDDGVLRAARRGHTAEDVRRAITMLKEAGFRVGIQLMPGLPGDTLNTGIRGVQELIRLGPHMARLYPVLVITGTELERLWREGRYRALQVSEAVHWCACLLLLLETGGVPVIRAGIHVSPEMVQENSVAAGPLDPALRHRVESFIYFSLAHFLLEPRASSAPEMNIRVPPADVSHMKGFRSENIRELERRLSVRVRVSPDASLPPRSMALEGEDPIIRDKNHLSLLLHMNHHALLRKFASV
ncbi:MAG: radical SAM protein [Deltaproteobacteria bacterium]|nr:radical SAM protein [Deltaproteobacteria bacterium]